jgi:hypothetical protein
MVSGVMLIVLVHGGGRRMRRTHDVVGKFIESVK